MVKTKSNVSNIFPGLLFEHLDVALYKRPLHQELPEDGGLTADEVSLAGQERRDREALLQHIFLLHAKDL